MAELDGRRGKGWDDSFAGKQGDELIRNPLFIRSLTDEVALQAIWIGSHAGMLPRLGLAANEKGLDLVMRPLEYPVGDDRRIRQLQFILNVIAVGLHYAGTDIQLRGNLSGAEPAANESENFQFPLGQPANVGNEIGITAVAIALLCFLSRFGLGASSISTVSSNFLSSRDNASWLVWIRP